MDKEKLVRILVKGGILSPHRFIKILESIKSMGVNHIHFGSRQDILFQTKNNDENIDKALSVSDFDFEIDTYIHQNIVSSYVALDVMPNLPWLTPNLYQSILDTFNYKPSNRINIVDGSQSMVPLFTGNINFIASNKENYWYCFLRMKTTNNQPAQYPKLIHTKDLAVVARFLEYLKPNEDLTVFEMIDSLSIRTEAVFEDLKHPDTHFPYYEGLNREKNQGNCALKSRFEYVFSKRV